MNHWGKHPSCRLPDFVCFTHTAQCSQKHSWLLVTTILLAVSLYIALLTSAGLHSFFPYVVLSVKQVWPQTKTPVYLISFSRVSFRIWGLCLRGVSDLPLAPPQSLILSSILLSFLCFSSISFIVFSLEQSLEMFQYLSNLHLFSGVATVPQSKIMPLISSKCGKQEFDPILTGSVPPDLKYIYNPSIQNNRLTSELGKSERKHTGGRTTSYLTNMGLRRSALGYSGRYISHSAFCTSSLFVWNRWK